MTRAFPALAASATADFPDGDCRDSNVCETTSDESTILKNGINNQFVFKTEEKKDMYTCGCLELRNYLVVAPEHVAIKFFHNFQASQKIGNHVRGSTTTSNGRFSPKTSVYWKDEPDKLIAEYEPGLPITYSVKELLDITGKSLDDEMDREFASLREEVVGDDGTPRDQPAPKRRVTGLVINMELIYDITAAKEGFTSDDTAKADLHISVTDSFTSWNPDVQMHERQLFDKTTGKYTRVYSELLNRGIMIRFTAKGKVQTFDWNVLYFNIISLLVLVPFVNKFVIAIAKFISPKREFYKKGLLEDLDYDHEMSKFAATSALITAQYKLWDKDGDGLEVHELADKLARDPKTVHYFGSEEGVLYPTVGKLEDCKDGKWDFDHTEGPPMDNFVFKNGTKYKVKFGDADGVDVDGSELIWGIGLPPATAKMFAEQIFSEQKRGIKSKAKKGTIDVVPITEKEANRARRLGVEDLVDTLSPDLCSFSTLSDHVAKKNRRRANMRNIPN
jgi:hypothetical protein